MRSDRLPILIFIVAVAAGLTALTPFTWLVLFTDGLFAAAIVVAATGWGAWPTAWLGFRRRSAGQQFCIATALGLGLLITMTLALGTAGLLNRPLAWVMLAAGGVCGLARLHLEWARGRSKPTRVPSLAQPQIASVILRVLLLLVLAGPLIVALFGASLPPGMLWQDEANGYDVLEYHLQGPREYYDAGRITFLPHNVYTSFPQQMEMLYLLLMHLTGDVYAAAIPAQLLHAACGILAVVALGCWAPAGWGRWLVVVSAGSTPWLAYVGCLAYVENGMLFFAAVAAGLIADHYRMSGSAGAPFPASSADSRWRTALTAGLCAGLAGGCKYTALVFVAADLVLAFSLTMRARFKLRVQRMAFFSLGALVAFSPWLVRNVAFTGNPVYPFAYAWFDGKAWSAEQAEQWSEGHRLPPKEASLTGRLHVAARELFGSFERQRFQPSLFGPLLFVLAVLGLVFGWSRRAAMLILWSSLILVGWIAFTFIPGRFAMPLIVPLAMLAGGALEPRGTANGKRRPDERIQPRWWGWSVLAVALLGALLNVISLGGRLRDHAERWAGRTGVPMATLVGQTGLFVTGHPLNQTLPADAYAWLVGDAAVYYVNRRIHYTVAFSRDPWLDFAAGGAGPDECLDWLRSRSVTHVVFSWSEIERLRATYGFPEVVTRDWVRRLERAGLRRVETETLPPGPEPVEVYELIPGPVR